MTIATTLSERLIAHDEFWTDYMQLRAACARSATNLSSLKGISFDGLDRLIYAASVLCQSDVEAHMNVAQAIALSAFISFPNSEVQESATSILATLGNFPSIHFIRNTEPVAEARFMGQLRTDLLAAINTVEVDGQPRALTDFQLSVWRSFSKESVISVSAPTSAGKSFVVIEHVRQLFSKSSSLCVVYIAPTRALVAEVQKRFELLLESDKEVRVTSVPAEDSLARKKQLYILTQERLSALNSVAKIKADLVVVDESQNLADGTRGMILQDSLERLVGRNPNIKMIFLSPGVTGFPEALREMGISNVEVRETTLSPVLQNRILVGSSAGDQNLIRLEVLDEKGRLLLGELRVERGVTGPARLAAISLELGSEGGSLVYATGAAEAEKICTQLALGLPESADQRLHELSSFVREHIHGDYGLADRVLKGVAFHYGHMPTLLREAIETAFKDGALRYMVCTTTLFQGINLPARNVFISTPTRGRKVPLDPAYLWNFAGRAGRLGRDIAGNVFLVDYDDWGSAPFDKPAQLTVKSALSDMLATSSELVASAINGDELPKERRDEHAAIRGAAGYLIARAAEGQIGQVLERLTSVPLKHRSIIRDVADATVNRLQLSASLLRQNWTVDPHGLARLKQRIEQEVEWGAADDMIPCSPSSEKAFHVYARIFNIVAKEVLGFRVGPYGAFVANYALAWMRGVPYPILVAKYVTYKRKSSRRADTDSLIRSAFEFMEETLRFQWVQLSKAYAFVLAEVLIDSGRSHKVREIYDFSLALELGISSDTGRSLMELGLSRISASVIESLLPDSALTVQSVREALRTEANTLSRLSSVIVEELKQLQLI